MDERRGWILKDEYTRKREGWTKSHGIPISIPLFGPVCLYNFAFSLKAASIVLFVILYPWSPSLFYCS